MSQNDPQWGRGGGSGDAGDGQRPPRRPDSQDGPPDLEELWRELNRRLGNLFGSPPGGPGATWTKILPREAVWSIDGLEIGESKREIPE